jgi:cell wall-associated NlpC family hydrolase
MMRRALIGAVVFCALAMAPHALAGIAEIRDAHGHLLASAGRGQFASVNDSGWTLRIDSASRSTRGVSLRGVSIAGGAIYAERIFVPAHGLRGASIAGLTIQGRSETARANTLVPLGPASYLVVLQEAVVPGEGSGIVGLRLVSGDSSLGITPGTQVLIGLARAASPPAHHRQAQLSWLSLGVAGHGPVITEESVFPTLPALPMGGTTGQRAVAIAERYLGIPYRWGGADPITGFDCSGFAMYVYAQLGINLTHYTGDQWYEGARVPPSMLEPGDLVFFEPSPNGPQHEGIYIGGGRFIQAPHTGDVIKISSLMESGYLFSYVGAVRPWRA